NAKGNGWIARSSSSNRIRNNWTSNATKTRLRATRLNHCKSIDVPTASNATKTRLRTTRSRKNPRRNAWCNRPLPVDLVLAQPAEGDSKWSSGARSRTIQNDIGVLLASWNRAGGHPPKLRSENQGDLTSPDDNQTKDW